MAVYVTKAWCRICQAKTVQNHITPDFLHDQNPTGFTVCTECGEQVR